MFVRKSTPSDMDEIMQIYACARKYMVAHGNATQWNGGYPQQKIVLQDILNGNNYVIVQNKKIVGTFSFIVGQDPTYQIIHEGNWRMEEEYGTIHRLASNQLAKGIAKTCFDFCITQRDYLRIDTHKNNIPMQKAIENYGFTRCGIIYVRDCSPRIAYDFIKGEE